MSEAVPMILPPLAHCVLCMACSVSPDASPYSSLRRLVAPQLFKREGDLMVLSIGRIVCVKHASI